MIQKSKSTNHDDRIFRYVVDAIACGELRAGTRIFEPDLCDRFDVSRTPVRQALTRLLQEGILEKTPGRRGYAIPMLTPEDMEQVFKAREAVEGQIAALACINATENDIQWLIKANEEERRLYEKLDKVEYAALNESFHFRLTTLSRNKYLQRFYGQLFWRTQVYIFHLGGFYTALDKDFMKAGRQHSYIEHRHLIDVLLEKNPEKAAEAAVAHIRSTLENRIGPRLVQFQAEKNITRHVAGIEPEEPI